MEGEKKVESEEKPEEMTEGKAEEAGQPVITRSIEEPEGTQMKPKIPAVLPDASWSTERLSLAIKDENMLVRSNAVMLLAQRKSEESLEPLIQALKDDEYLVKSNAMVALSSLGPSIAPRMTEALSDADPGIRAGAAWVLGEFKDHKAIEALEKAAHDDNPLVRIQAKASLTAMGRWPPKKPGAIEAEPTEAEPAEAVPAEAEPQPEEAGAEETKAEGSKEGEGS